MTGPEEVRLRDALPPLLEGDLKETGARLAREGQTEKEAEAAGIGWYRPAELYRLRLGAFEVLLPAYLEESGVSAKEALDVLELLGSGSLYDIESFEAEDPNGLKEFRETERRFYIARSIAEALHDKETGTVDPEKSVTVDAPADLIEAVRAEARVVSEQGQGAAFAWLVNGPDCVQAAAAKCNELLAPYELSKKERAAKAKRILKKRMDPVAYLKGRGWGGGFLRGDIKKVAILTLTAILRRQGEGPEKAFTDPTATAGRLIVPQAFLGLAEPVSVMARRRRSLDPYDDETQTQLAFLEEVEESRSQMAEFSTTELRVIIGAFASYSQQPDNGRSWPLSIRVGLQKFAKNCALDLSSGKNRDDLLKALKSVSSKQVNATITFYEQKQRKALLYSGPVIKASPIVGASTPSAIEALEEWRETGVWKGDAPEEILLEIQEVYGFLGSALVLDHAVLHRIDMASKKVRGRGHGTDLLLFWMLFRLGPRQMNHEGPNGYPKTYINRERFLEECHGAEKVTREKQAGRYRSRIEEPYLKSVKVLEEAGIIFSDWQAGHEGRGGKRDVFEVQPWVIKGSESNKKSLPKGRRGISAGKGAK